jgi:hypothetical protein
MGRTRKLAGALAAIGLAAGLAMAGPGTARADVIPPAGWAEIFNPYLHAQNTTLCVDDPSGSLAILQKIQLFRCHGYDSHGSPQRWFFEPAGTTGIFGNFNVYHIRNTGSGLCLGLTTNVPNTAGRDVIQLQCTDTATEWFLVPLDRSNPNSDFQLEFLIGYPFVNSWCMAASNFTDSSPTRLVNASCADTDTSQLWNLG